MYIRKKKIYQKSSKHKYSDSYLKNFEKPFEYVTTEKNGNKK